MRIIVAGSRDCLEQDVRFALDECAWIGFVTAIVSGTAKGADRFGEYWAKDHDVPVVQYPADWKTYGKRAGPVRNEVMARNAEGLVAIWNGKSRGTASMIQLAEKHGLRVEIFRTDLDCFFQIAPRDQLLDWWEFVEERAGILEFGNGIPRQEAERLSAKEALARFPRLSERQTSAISSAKSLLEA